jgi:hypothetical protein
MSDRTNLTMTVLSTDPEVRAGARAAFEEYSGGDMHFEDVDDDTEIMIGANEVVVGSASDLARDLDALIEQGEKDFAYYVHEDPAYEWLGSVVIHVPGLTPDFMGSCDADGMPVLEAAHIDEILAIADDTEMRIQLRLRAGREHTEAFAHHAAMVTDGGATVAPPVSPATGEADR